MHLADVLSRRSVPGAVVAMALTRRCPLRCRHCSTDSGPSSQQHAASLFTGFAATFSRADRPEYLLLTGGEPLLRPDLVAAVAALARAAGTRTYLLSGMFFARQPGIPPDIWRAIQAIDHLAASLDAFHEAEVARESVFAALRRVLDEGKDVSLQIVGSGDDDPYLAEATEAARRAFDDRVPILVGRVAPAGRAASWRPHPPAPTEPTHPPAPTEPTHPPAPTKPTQRTAARTLRADPCAIAAWPVVGFDGTVTACGNQWVVDHDPLPAHLRLGHVAVDGWPAIRQRCVDSPVLRALRVFGPAYLAGTDPSSGYCTACWTLSDPAAVAHPAIAVLEAQLTAVQVRAGAVGFARRYGCARYADLVLLGYPDREPVP